MRLAFALSASALAALLPVQNASASCGNLGNGLAAQMTVSPTTAHLGETITINIISVTIPSDDCDTVLAKCWVTMPNNQTQLVFTNGTIFRGQSFGCPTNGFTGTGVCLPNLITTYVVTNTDINKDLSFSPPDLRDFSDSCGGTVLLSGNTFTLSKTPGFVQFMPSGEGVAPGVSCLFDLPVTGSGSQRVRIVSPAIAITKNCPAGCTEISATSFTVTGTISNTGDVPLLHVNVTDSPAFVPGSLTFSDPTFVNGSSGLAVGASVDYSARIALPAGSCGPVHDDVTVTADDGTGVPLGNVSATAHADCPICTRPCIDVTKTCPNTVTNCIAAGVTYPVSGTVVNCGDVQLDNVNVYDTNCDGTVSHVFGPATLAPGETQNWNGTAPVCRCGPNTDTVTAIGTDHCRGTNVQDVASCTTTNVCPPHITVTKLVACGPAQTSADCNPPTSCTGTLDYRKFDQGFAGTNQTEFCYKITVCNDGCDAVTINSVSDRLQNGSTGFTASELAAAGFAVPFNLAVGECKTGYLGKSYGVGNYTNTVTFNGVGSTSGIGVSTNDTAQVSVCGVSVKCAVLVHAFGDTDQFSGTCSNTVCVGDDNHATLPTSETVDVGLFITNTGCADLVVNITGLLCSVDVDGNPVTSSVVVAAGATYGPIVCQTFVTCPTNITFPFTVQGSVTNTAQVAGFCIYDSCGRVIKTAASTCSGSADCTVPQTIQCRTTGGGILVTNFHDTTCGVQSTTIFPNPTLIDKITHGGQLGAPFSQMDCGETIGNPCIRGNWSHHRHYAGSNQEDQFDTDFHSSTPGVLGVYDSLECACLGCCSGDSTTASSGFTTVIHRKTVCNPDDRVCGPEPRPAPANAIIFSGIGTFSAAGAKKSTYMVFRVYIEDRSEPGGWHPKGETEPADVYCFQAWDTGIAVNNKADPNCLGNSQALGMTVNAFRKKVAAADCAFLDDLSKNAADVGKLPSGGATGLGNVGKAATVNDCGPLYSGNHQIHPSTSATCDNTSGGTACP
jgi:hypothetical protein